MNSMNTPITIESLIEGIYMRSSRRRNKRHSYFVGMPKLTTIAAFLRQQGWSVVVETRTATSSPRRMSSGVYIGGYPKESNFTYFKATDGNTTFVRSHESRPACWVIMDVFEKFGARWNPQANRFELAAPSGLAKDKAAVAAALAGSAMHSRVEVPEGHDFERDLGLVEAHLRAQFNNR